MISSNWLVIIVWTIAVLVFLCWTHPFVLVATDRSTVAQRVFSIIPFLEMFNLTAHFPLSVSKRRLRLEVNNASAFFNRKYRRHTKLSTGIWQEAGFAKPNPVIRQIVEGMPNRPYFSSDEAGEAASPLSGGGVVGSASGGGGGAAAGGGSSASGGGAGAEARRGGEVGFATCGGTSGAGVVTGGSGWPFEPGNADSGSMFGLSVDDAAGADPGAGEDLASVDDE
jgi:hypothetical protein